MHSGKGEAGGEPCSHHLSLILSAFIWKGHLPPGSFGLFGCAMGAKGAWVFAQEILRQSHEVGTISSHPTGEETRDGTEI